MAARGGGHRHHHHRGHGGGGAAAVPPAAHPPPAPAAEDEGGEVCLVCAEELSGPRAVYSCNHAVICGMCCARLRLLGHSRLCVVCKADVEQVVVTQEWQPTTTFDDFGIYGAHAGPSYTWDAAAGIFWHASAEELRRKVLQLRQYRCGVTVGATGGRGGSPCTDTFTTLAALNEHLESRHGHYVCGLCVDNRAVFINELPRLTAKALAAHCTVGDPDAGFRGHPLCRFCDQRYFSDTELYTHLNREHFSCHICARHDRPDRREFFKAYPDLHAHFKARHYPCDDPKCMAAKYVVFDDALALQAHAAEAHGATADLTGHLAFRITSAAEQVLGPSARVGAYSGRARPPPVGPTAGGGGAASGDGVTMSSGDDASPSADDPTHPRHMVLSAEDFPSLSALSGALPAYGGGGGGARGGSGSGGFARAVNSNAGSMLTGSDAFPALPSGGGGDGFRRVASRSNRRPHWHAYTTLDQLLMSSGQGHLVRPSASGGGGSSSGGSWGGTHRPASSKPLPGFPSRAIGDVPAARVVDAYNVEAMVAGGGGGVSAKPGGGAGGRAGSGKAEDATPTPSAPAPAPAPAPPPAAPPSVSEVIGRVRAALGDTFDSFKGLSVRYRSGDLPPADYHHSAHDLFVRGGHVDDATFATLFGDLVATLPDADRREALASIHAAWMQTALPPPHAPEPVAAAPAPFIPTTGRRYAAAASSAGAVHGAPVVRGVVAPAPVHRGPAPALASSEAFPALPAHPSPSKPPVNALLRALTGGTTSSKGGSRPTVPVDAGRATTSTRPHAPPVLDDTGDEPELRAPTFAADLGAHLSLALAGSKSKKGGGKKGGGKKGTRSKSPGDSDAEDGVYRVKKKPQAAAPTPTVEDASGATITAPLQAAALTPEDSAAEVPVVVKKKRKGRKGEDEEEEGEEEEGMGASGAAPPIDFDTLMAMAKGKAATTTTTPSMQASCGPSGGGSTGGHGGGAGTGLNPMGAGSARPKLTRDDFPTLTPAAHASLVATLTGKAPPQRPSGGGSARDERTAAAMRWAAAKSKPADATRDASALDAMIGRTTKPVGASARVGDEGGGLLFATGAPRAYAAPAAVGPRPAKAGKPGDDMAASMGGGGKKR